MKDVKSKKLFNINNYLLIFLDTHASFIIANSIANLRTTNFSFIDFLYDSIGFKKKWIKLFFICEVTLI